MSPLPSTPRGMYFEEFQTGLKFTTTARTITEADIVAFAGLSGDFNQIHTDAEYSKNSPFGQRVAHGLLGLSIISGLAVQTGIVEGTIMAWREINEWKFVQPVLIGDTIHAEMEIIETKLLRRIGGGAVVLDLAVKNQRDQTVMKGMWTFLVASR